MRILLSLAICLCLLAGSGCTTAAQSAGKVLVDAAWVAAKEKALEEAEKAKAAADVKLAEWQTSLSATVRSGAAQAGVTIPNPDDPASLGILISSAAAGKTDWRTVLAELAVLAIILIRGEMRAKKTQALVTSVSQGGNGCSAPLQT